MNGFPGKSGIFTLLIPVLILTGLSSAAAQTTLDISTYYGGSALEGQSRLPIVEAADGTVYIVTNSYSSDVPVTQGAFQPESAGSYDLVIAHFSQDMTTLLAATYLGGIGSDASYPGVDMAIAADGSIYVISTCGMNDWPMTPGAYQTAPAGSTDQVLARLSPDLDQLLASTYLGGMGAEDFGMLACLPDGDVMVVCCTASYNFPTTSGAYREVRPGGRDLAMARLDANLTTLEAGTYLGSSTDDWPEVLRIDQEGNPYVTGWTRSSAFPTTDDAYQTVTVGDYQAFISRMSGDLSALEASTFIGGNAWEFGYGLAIDTSGDVFACGHTASLNFPVTAGCYQPAHAGTGDQGGDDDIWVARFDHDLTQLMAATYLGGTGWENAVALVPIPGGVVVGGTTSSFDWPVTSGAIDDIQSGGGKYYTREIALAILDKDLTTLRAGSYLGSTGADNLGSLWPTADGGVWLIAGTACTDLPVNPGAYDPTHNGGSFDYGGDIFLARLGSDLGPVGSTPAPLPRSESALQIMGASPNPFNPCTEVAFFLGSELDLNISIHDAAGRRVAVLADRNFTAGHHAVAWTGRDSSGRSLPSGVYLARIAGTGVQQSVKLVLVK